MNAESYDDFEWYEKINATLVRLDAKLLKKPDGYYLWVHYHITPDMSEHHDIAEIYMGKNKPAGW
ncbi:YpjP family protein [Brevibacillus agri]|uniref:YpjP family protein n=1 Tax=Brevibacillus agri TaxID=51101 RepID=UPI002E21BEC3|nr:YpjP family protein [Brevibacillus agri]